MKRIWILGLALALVLTAVGAPVSGKHYSDWSAPVKITDSGINTAFIDSCPAITKDGLSLYFASNRPAEGTTPVPRDLYVSQRATTNDPWGVPQKLGANINEGDERCPYVTPDGRRLIFVRQQVGSTLDDFYMSTRQDEKDDFGWGVPVKIEALNSAGMETAAWGFENENGTLTLYFGAARPGSGMDIYQSTMDRDGNFATPVPVAELNDPIAIDYGPIVRKDGLELYFTSNRAGSVYNSTVGSNSQDIWVSTRNSTSEQWSAPVNLGPEINTSQHEWRFALSWDGMSVIFNRVDPYLTSLGPPPGWTSWDLYTTERTKVLGKDK